LILPVDVILCNDSLTIKTPAGSDNWVHSETGSDSAPGNCNLINPEIKYSLSNRHPKDIALHTDEEINQ
jgi:hypothetical protein